MEVFDPGRPQHGHTTDIVITAGAEVEQESFEIGLVRELFKVPEVELCGSGLEILHRILTREELGLTESELHGSPTHASDQVGVGVLRERAHIPHWACSGGSSRKGER